MDTDGNLYALKKYQEQQEIDERAYESFNEELICRYNILDRYEKLKKIFNGVTNEYGYIMTFEEWLGEQ